MKRITHWTIKVTWENGAEEYLDDIPNYVACTVDDFLTELEEDLNSCLSDESEATE